MGYWDLIHSMQKKAGFTDTEAEEVLDLMVETIAERLEERDREEFASELPEELQEVVLSVVEPDEEEYGLDMVEAFMDKENIGDEGRAERQVATAWETLKLFITEDEIRHIKLRLPSRAAASLN